MNTVLQVLLLIAGTLAGAAIGGVLAFYGTFYGCVFIDYLRGKSGGDGILTIGWLFLIVTVPTGAFLGGKAAFWMIGSYLIRE